MEKISVVVEKIEKQCNDTSRFVLLPEKKINFVPGQFIMVNIPMKDTFVRRAYSIACPPGDKLEVCMNYLPMGKGSEFFFNLKGGESFEIDGPYGIFKLKESGNSKLFICTGTGVAPLRSMILYLLENGCKDDIVLVFGEKTEEELLYREEFEKLSRKFDNFTYVPTLSRTNGEWKGEKGYVQDVMKKYIKKLESVDSYICGLKEMVDDVKRVLSELGVKNIYTEKFG